MEPNEDFGWDGFDENLPDFYPEGEDYDEEPQNFYDNDQDFEIEDY